MIYGRETTEFVLDITDLNGAVVDGTVDWVISDAMLDGITDNSDEYVDQLIAFKPTKIYESAGTKTINVELDFNDGWDNIYRHVVSKNVEVSEYEVPVLDFNWTPLEPTILDTITITQGHDDISNGLVNKQYGRIDEVRIDYYNDGVYEVDFVDDTATPQYQFNTKQDNIEIRLNATYWNGWEHKTTDLVKTMNMSNIPPVAAWSREDLGVCVPNFNWTATSTDLDDDDNALVHTWKLYKDEELISSHTGSIYTYPFQFEGSYRLVLRSTDVEGAFSEKTETFGVVFSTCDSTGGGGEWTPILKLQSNVWQLVALPIKGGKVYEDVLMKLENQTGVGIADLVTLCTTYYGDENRYRAFAVGVTNPLSDNNFPLVYNDTGTEEVTAFWIRTKDFAAVGLPDTIVLEW